MRSWRKRQAARPVVHSREIASMLAEGAHRGAIRVPKRAPKAQIGAA